VASATAALFTLAPAWANEDYSGSYLCIQQSGGGLYYYGANGWGGTTFKPEGKFVIRLYDKTEKPAYDGAKWNNSFYNVEVSEFGAKPGTCFGNADFGTVEFFGDTSRLECESSSVFWVDFNTMRFLEAYPYGFIDGKDNNDNTPSMMGGTCAKIN